MLRAFGHRVATCCDMLGVVGSNLKMVKFFTQHLRMLHDVVVVWPGPCNNVGICCSECCDRLARALRYLDSKIGGLLTIRFADSFSPLASCFPPSNGPKFPWTHNLGSIEHIKRRHCATSHS